MNERANYCKHDSTAEWLALNRPFGLLAQAEVPKGIERKAGRFARELLQRSSGTCRAVSSAWPRGELASDRLFLSLLHLRVYSTFTHSLTHTRISRNACE